MLSYYSDSKTDGQPDDRKRLRNANTAHGIPANATSGDEKSKCSHNYACQIRTGVQGAFDIICETPLNLDACLAHEYT